MVVRFAQPSIVNPRRTATPIPRIANADIRQLTSSIPGVRPGGSQANQAGTVNPQEYQSNVRDPLEAFQKSVRTRIEQGQQHNQQLQQLTQSRLAKEQQRKKQQDLERLRTLGIQGNITSTSNYQGKGLQRGYKGYANGQIPTSALTKIASGHYMRPDAAAAFARMNAAYRKTFGVPMSITDSYRSIGSQHRLARTKPRLAATPGTSNHGWGTALDLGGGINRWGTAQNNWMHQNAARFGFAPLSGNLGRIEPWHWEFRG